MKHRVVSPRKNFLAWGRDRNVEPVTEIVVLLNKIKLYLALDVRHYVSYSFSLVSNIPHVHGRVLSRVEVILAYWAELGAANFLNFARASLEPKPAGEQRLLSEVADIDLTRRCGVQKQVVLLGVKLWTCDSAFLVDFLALKIYYLSRCVVVWVP